MPAYTKTFGPVFSLNPNLNAIVFIEHYNFIYDMNAAYIQYIKYVYTYTVAAEPS